MTLPATHNTPTQANNGGFCPYVAPLFNALEAQSTATGASSSPTIPLLLLGLTSDAPIYPGHSGTLVLFGSPATDGNSGVTRLLLGKGSEAARGVLGHCACPDAGPLRAKAADVTGGKYQGFIAVFPSGENGGAALAAAAAALNGGAAAAAAVGGTATDMGGRERERERSLSPSGAVVVKREEGGRVASRSPSPSGGVTMGGVGAASGGGAGGDGSAIGVQLLPADECCHTKTCVQYGKRLKNGGACRRVHAGEHPGFVPTLCRNGDTCHRRGGHCEFFHSDELDGLVRRVMVFDGAVCVVLVKGSVVLVGSGLV